MLPALVSTMVVLVIGAITLGLVLLGMEGRGQRRVPKLAGTMVRAARLLNGDHRDRTARDDVFSR